MSQGLQKPEDAEKKAATKKPLNSQPAKARVSGECCHCTDLYSQANTIAVHTVHLSRFTVLPSVILAMLLHFFDPAVVPIPSLL